MRAARPLRALRAATHFARQRVVTARAGFPVEEQIFSEEQISMARSLAPSHTLFCCRFCCILSSNLSGRRSGMKRMPRRESGREAQLLPLVAGAATENLQGRPPPTYLGRLGKGCGTLWADWLQ